MNDVLARIHNVDYSAVGLGDFGRKASTSSARSPLVEPVRSSAGPIMSSRWSS